MQTPQKRKRNTKRILTEMPGRTGPLVSTAIVSLGAGVKLESEERGKAEAREPASAANTTGPASAASPSPTKPASEEKEKLKKKERDQAKPVRQRLLVSQRTNSKTTEFPPTPPPRQHRLKPAKQT